MDTPTRAIVRRALDELKPYLASYVSQALAGLPGDIRLRHSDTYALLATIIAKWDAVFSELLAANVRNFVFELKEVRNRWAHEESFDWDDARRAIDTTRLVAKAIGAPPQLLDLLQRLCHEATADSAREMPGAGTPVRVSPPSVGPVDGRAPESPKRVAPMRATPRDAIGASLNASRASAPRPAKQRDVMRQLWARFAPDEERVIREYAAAERRGEVGRTSNAYGITPEDYARRLFADGQAKGWISTEKR